MLGTVCTGSACPSRRHAVARPAGGLARHGAWPDSRTRAQRRKRGHAGASGCLTTYGREAIQLSRRAIASIDAVIEHAW